VTKGFIRDGLAPSLFSSMSQAMEGTMIPPEKVEILRKLWMEGVSGTEIARQLNISPSVVYAYAKALGLPPRRRGRLSSEDVKRMIELLKEGLPPTEIARQLNISPNTVVFYAKILGIRRRTNGRAKHGRRCIDIDRRQLEELARSGLTTVEIARATGTSASCIEKLARIYGIPIPSLTDKVVEEVRRMLESRGFATLSELRNVVRAPIPPSIRILSRLRGMGLNVEKIRIRATSTPKYSVLPRRVGETIIYIKGRESDVAAYIVSEFKRHTKGEVPPRALLAVLRANGVPEAIIREVERIMRYGG